MIKNSAKVSHGPSVAESEVWDIKMAKATDQQLIGALTSSPPLTFSGDFFSALLRYAEAEFPIFMTSGTMFGGSGPATLAGSLISYNAEMMAGLVLTQIVKPRLGFIAGNYSHPLNMKTGSPIAGGIERGIFQIAFDQIWRHYKVPCSFALSSDSKVPDYQCAYEKTMNAVLAALSGCNIIHMAGGVYDEITWSPVVAVIDNDILHMIGRVLEGIEVTDETLALDLIEEVGQIPGHFLNREHTRKWWKREQFIPDLADRLSYDDWVRRGSKEILTRAKQKVEEILTEHEPTSLPKDQAKEIDRILEEAREYYKKRSMI
jgi:trimethylamine--corrinoid protein Co-methyltransferase